MVEIDIIENGDRSARIDWQARQLRNLLKHAETRSEFWRRRLSPNPDLRDLATVPVLSRAELSMQAATEGALLDKPALAPSYASTGSGGVPVRVFYTSENAYYNSIRTLSQYFILGLPLGLNQIRVRHANVRINDEEIRRTVLTENWAGALGRLFVNGSRRELYLADDGEALCAEIEKGDIGYFVGWSHSLRVVLNNFSVAKLRSLGMRFWIHLSDRREAEDVSKLENEGIRCLSSYSSAEIGPIAFECAQVHDHYHVAHSNVVVEADPSDVIDDNGRKLMRLLITQLHSYATPIIRYNLGDYGIVQDSCRCGHQGTTLSHIVGRGKNLLVLSDDRQVPFFIHPQRFLSIINFKDMRMQQDKSGELLVRFAGCQPISDAQKTAIERLISAAAGCDIVVYVSEVSRIDWSDNPKRLVYSSRCL